MVKKIFKFAIKNRVIQRFGIKINKSINSCLMKILAFQYKTLRVMEACGGGVKLLCTKIMILMFIICGLVLVIFGGQNNRFLVLIV